MKLTKNAMKLVENAYNMKWIRATLIKFYNKLCINVKIILFRRFQLKRKFIRAA